MLHALTHYPRTTFELGFGYETQARHPYHIDYKDQKKRTWMAYIPVFGQLVYTIQLIWLFKKNVSYNFAPYSPEWTGRFFRSVCVISGVGVFVALFFDAIGTLTIHLHSKDKNAEYQFYSN